MLYYLTDDFIAECGKIKGARERMEERQMKKTSLELFEEMNKSRATFTQKLEWTMESIGNRIRLLNQRFDRWEEHHPLWAGGLGVAALVIMGLSVYFM